MSDLTVIYSLYAFAGLIAIFDRTPSSLPLVLTGMAMAFRISIAIEARK